jgi:endonuclease III related protein
MNVPRDSALHRVYEQLHVTFGPQHWWPGDTEFEMMVGAILTQNTNWRNVEKAISNLKREGLLAPASLASVERERLATLIRPAGYYNIKAVRLKEFVVWFVATYHGDVRRMRERPLKDLRDELLAVKGVGPETADSILLYACRKPTFVVDAYTRRVFSRHGFFPHDWPYERIRRFFQEALSRDAGPRVPRPFLAGENATEQDACRPSPPVMLHGSRPAASSSPQTASAAVVTLYNEYHALIVRLAKLFCRTKPLCDVCPVRGTFESSSRPVRLTKHSKQPPRKSVTK